METNIIPFEMIMPTGKVSWALRVISEFVIFFGQTDVMAFATRGGVVSASIASGRFGWTLGDLHTACFYLEGILRVLQHDGLVRSIRSNYQSVLGKPARAYRFINEF